MSYRFGDVVLVAFPFTDQSARKQRPAVVVSSAAYHRAKSDLIIMAITSQLRPTASLGEVVVQNWQAAGLLKPSVVKPVITTLEQRLVRKSLGTLSGSDQQQLREAIKQIIA